MKSINFLVSARCFTFNHASYIEDAMKGFCMQQTNFPFVCVIVDDASTDGEPVVIDNFLHSYFDLNNKNVVRTKETDDYRMVYAQHKKNKYCYFAVYYLKYNHYSIKKTKFPYFAEFYDNVRYHALCEGDDYWVNPHKIQLQVAFMEANPDYVLCYTDFDLSNGKRRNHANPKAEDDNYFPQSITQGVKIGTATTLIRKEAYNKLQHLYSDKGWSMGDLPMWIELSYEGKFKFLPIVTTHYRMVDNSASHGTLEKEVKFAEESLQIRRFYANYFKIKMENDGYSKGFFVTLMKCAYKHSDKLYARRVFKDAMKECKLSFKLCVFMLGTCSKLIRKLLRYYYH